MKYFAIILLHLLLCPSLFAGSSCKGVITQSLSESSELHEIDIEASILAAGLSEHRDVILQSGAKIQTIYDFLAERESMGLAFLLGIDGLGIVKALSMYPNLMRWTDGYNYVHHRPQGINHTKNYMNTITKLDLPIVFIVPPALMSRRGITNDEMNWLLENPSRLSKITFVFGAYNFLPDPIFARFDRTRDTTEIRSKIQEISNQLSEK